MEPITPTPTTLPYGQPATRESQGEKFPWLLIKRNPPLFERIPPPEHFKTMLDRQRYWAQQKKYWLEGWNHLPGHLYHYWQEQKIKLRDTGKTIRPVYREADIIVHDKIRECREILNKMLLIYKCRGIGLTTAIGSLANYFLRAYPGSTSLITSADQQRISKLYTDKIKVANENYHPDIRYEIGRRSETQSKTYMQLLIKYLDDDGREQITTSDIYCNQTNDSDESAMSFSGTGAVFGGYDEAPLNKRIIKLLRSSEECYRDMNTGKQTGFLLLGGTIEENITTAQLFAFRQLVEQKEVFNMEELFIPFQWRFHDTHGLIDFDAAERWYEVEYNRKAKSEDPTDLIAFKKNNPRSREDIFDLAAGGIFEDDVVQKIKVQYDTVIAERVAAPSYNIVEMGEGDARAIPDAAGKVVILEPPQEGLEYYLNIDGVATGVNVSGEEGSKVAAVMMKTFDAKSFPFSVCAGYYERPKTIEASYILLVAMARYYNKYGGFKGFSAEANAGTADHFSTFLHKVGMGKYIIMRKDLSGKGYSNTKRYFQYVTNQVRDYQIRFANIFLRKYIQSIRWKALLEHLMLPAEENADIRDAFLMFFVALPPDFDKPREKPKVKPRLRPTIIMDSDGNSRTVWVEYTTGRVAEKQPDQMPAHTYGSIPKDRADLVNQAPVVIRPPDYDEAKEKEEKRKLGGRPKINDIRTLYIDTRRGEGG